MVLRDIATWVVGAWWGNGLMQDPDPHAYKVFLVLATLGLPFTWRADELRRWLLAAEQPSVNGTTAQDSLTP